MKSETNNINIVNKEKLKNTQENISKLKDKINKGNYSSSANKENISFDKENHKDIANYNTEPNKEVDLGLPKDSKDEMDKVLSNLRKAYTEMKHERQKTEKDYEHLENKLKMLQTEETKAFKKFQNEKKFKEEWESARNKTLEYKNFLSEVKDKKKHEVEGMSKKIKDMKEYIQRSLNVKKMMRFQENRLSNLQMKQKKIENIETRRSIMREDATKNKRMAESVKMREKTFIEQKKHNEEDRKKKLKKELEEKLMDEQRKKKLFENKLNSLEELESGLLKRIKDSGDLEVINSERKYRSASAGSSVRKSKK